MLIPVTIINGGMIINSKTVNISRSGVQIEDKLPKEFHERDLTLTMDIPDENDETQMVLFQARVVPDKPDRLKFQNLTEENEEVIGYLLGD